MRTRLIFLSLVCGAAGWASTFSVDFDQVQLSGAPGDTLTFSGTLTNNTGATVYLNGAGLTLAGFDPSDYDASDFLFNAPLTLDDGTTSADFNFFTVSIPNGFSAGQYLGTLDVQGGPGSTDDSLLGSGDFAVNVTDSSAPEPGSFGLLIIGLAMLRYLGSVVRRRSGHSLKTTRANAKSRQSTVSSSTKNTNLGTPRTVGNHGNRRSLLQTSDGANGYHPRRPQERPSIRGRNPAAVQLQQPRHRLPWEIGRASCRERV